MKGAWLEVWASGQVAPQLVDGVGAREIREGGSREQAVLDRLGAFPGILLTLVIIAVLGPDLQSAMIAVGISGMPLFIRVVRGSTLAVRELHYVEAAQATGCGDLRVLARHVLPNVLTPVIVLVTLGIPSAIVAGAALSFLGLGIKPPTPDWGEMLSRGGRSWARCGGSRRSPGWPSRSSSWRSTGSGTACGTPSTRA